MNHEKVKQLIRQSGICSEGQAAITEILREIAGYNPPEQRMPKAGEIWLRLDSLVGPACNQVRAAQFLIETAADGKSGKFLSTGENAENFPKENWIEQGYMVFYATNRAAALTKVAGTGWADGITFRAGGKPIDLRATATAG